MEQNFDAYMRRSSYFKYIYELGFSFYEAEFLISTSCF